ncbi:T7SS effector LXG polymorphic toxin [Enterococcus faecalis]|uniref:T7SS effector LXG polymorphic toxin n=1 Tax=Enterococcus TaxID=1350 RepID=UPI001F08C14A|nr:T7SS effector LXG polymorphic toxin [Enterococcus faecalis]MDN3196934.1 T7SS effector LXG polymorphic toxin [Enterococcus faecalis]MDT2085566.1 T7SS effector LXG polymorphic toxin [Enterococcus faecalis]
MGLIYSSSDSSAMMRALSSNLAVARTTTSELTAGCQQLIAAIDGHTLSGAAYNAGKGLFSELVIPTIHRMTAAVDNVQSDLAKYSAADAFIASEGFLDEDKLKLKIKIMKANQQLLHDSAREVAMLAHSHPIPGIYELLQNAQRTFIKMAESMQQDIDKLHKQIQKLNEFDRQTKNLFATSLEEMQLATQGILVLNETTVKNNGLYTLPSGVDKSYFTEIKKDTKNEVTDKQLLAGCTILYVHDKKNGFNYYMLEKDGYSYRIDEKKLSGNLASLIKKYDLDVVELTPKELTIWVNNQQKKGYNYFEKDDRVLGLGLLSKGQGVMDEIQESGVWDSLWMLGLSTAVIRSTQTFSKETGSTGNVLKGSKNGQAYTLDRNKSAGTVPYKKASGANPPETDFGVKNSVSGKDWNNYFKDKYGVGNVKWKNPVNSVDNIINTPSSLANVNPTDIVEFVEKEGWTATPLKKGGNAGIPFEQGGGFSMNPPAGSSGSSRYIQYHPGGGHHGDLPYYKVSSPEYGITRIYMNGKVVKE